jgi:hypothetical protein
MDRRHPARLIRHAAQRTCRRSMRTATAALETTMSRPSSLAGSHRVSLPISSQGAAKDCALSLTWSGRAAENAGLLKRQHRSRSQRRFPEDALAAKVGCRRILPGPARSGGGRLTERTPAVSLGGGNGSKCAIMFSNGSRAAARWWAISTLSGVCVLCVLTWHLMGSAGCKAAWLKSPSAKLTAATVSAPSFTPSLGRRSAWELGTASCSVMQD